MYILVLHMTLIKTVEAVFLLHKTIKGKGSYKIFIFQ